MPPHVAGLTGATLETAPTVCHRCVWWQSRAGRNKVEKERWIEKAEDEWGAWGSIYYDADRRVLGSVQYGPSTLFPRAAELPAGPAAADDMLVAWAYLIDSPRPWMIKSLFITAIGEAKDKGAKALETFGYRYPEGKSTYERFQVHKTIFPRDFLSDFGFRTVRSAGLVELVRLELGGLEPVLQGRRTKVMRALREIFQPAPVPQRP